LSLRLLRHTALGLLDTIFLRRIAHALLAEALE